ncbi:NADPH-dependent FMN reductase [Planotetraspora sp. GP83]|uniref:NADPH-dependent FMN reductase n=1 Tax=Planotetraspora sp. GP83 TaxID=3156264 RepID=UPI003515CEF3
MTPFHVLVGNPKPHSRTRQIAVHSAHALGASLGGTVGEPRLIDLAELMADLLGQWNGGGGLDEILTAVRTPGGLLLVASPTFKAAYTGLLKLFIDLLPKGGLRDVVAVPLMTAASPRHGQVAETMLGPLLAEVGASVPAPALCLLEAEFDALDGKLGPWLEQAVPVLRRSLG